MASSQTTITPHNQQPLVTRTYPSEPELGDVIRRAAVAHQLWARVPLKGRLAIGAKFVVCARSRPDIVAESRTYPSG
jgi:hypothetical protein